MLVPAESVEQHGKAAPPTLVSAYAPAMLVSGLATPVTAPPLSPLPHPAQARISIEQEMIRANIVVLPFCGAAGDVRHTQNAPARSRSQSCYPGEAIGLEPPVLFEGV